MSSNRRFNPVCNNSRCPLSLAVVSVFVALGCLIFCLVWTMTRESVSQTQSFNNQSCHNITDPEAAHNETSSSIASVHVALQTSGHSLNTGCFNMNDDSNFSPLTLSRTLNLRIEHATNIIVLPECLIVRQAGIYQVYASVHFKPRSSQCDLVDDPKIMRFRVSKKSGAYPHEKDVLLMATTICSNNCQQFEHTLYTGGTFYFQINDTLAVEVSAPEFVVLKSTTSFMGAVLLSI